jgi:hypothetical protein
VLPGKISSSFQDTAFWSTEEKAKDSFFEKRVKIGVEFGKIFVSINYRVTNPIL